MKNKLADQIKIRRQNRSRAKIFGTGEKPRLSVFRSNRYIYAQLIDDEVGKTVASASSNEVGNKKKMTKNELAKLVGGLIAKKALENKIKSVIFDRGSYRYHGRVKNIAEGAREGGLKF